MNRPPTSVAAPEETDEVRIAQKVRWHLLPLLFLLYIVAYLDRVNVGFASLTMNHELALTSEQYGLLSGMFFWGYFLFEIPSNLILHRIGARKWIARILITWGLVAVVTGFVQNATQLYVARFILGAAEAGFYPGIVYYLSYWFRQREQAQAIGLFLTALPTASILGGPASGWILDHVHAIGMSSWRWLLILEALPAIACGLLTYRMLPDRPPDATFLTNDEKVRLVQALTAEAIAKPGAQSLTALKALTHPRVLHLAAIHFLFLMGLYITGFWMPQSIKSVATTLSNTAVGVMIIIPNLAGLVSMVLVARSSDRCSERHFHAAIPLLCAATALFFVGAAPSVAICVTLWCIAAAGLDSYLGPFWAFPGEFLTGRSAACGYAFINSVGSLGAYFGLAAIGSIATKINFPVAELCTLMRARRLPVLTSISPIFECEWPTTTINQEVEVQIPEQLKSREELLILCYSSAIQPGPGAGHANLALVIATPANGRINLYPQDWFNDGKVDLGYQWVTRIARDPRTHRIRGDGIRISPFVLDQDLRVRTRP